MSGNSLNKYCFLVLLFLFYNLANIFGQTFPVKILNIYSPNNIVEQDIIMGMNIDDINLQLIEVADEEFLPIPNVRIFALRDFNDASHDNSPSVILLFFYNNKLFGILNGYYFYGTPLPSSNYSIKEFEETHNQIVYSLQKKLNLYGKFSKKEVVRYIPSEETSEETDILTKHISPNLTIILEHTFSLYESWGFGTNSKIAVSYFDTNISSEITEDEILNLYNLYFYSFSVHYRFKNIWEKL